MTGNHSQTTTEPRGGGKNALLIAISVLAAVVVIAPVSLSAQDLYDWAASPTGLGLPWPWPIVVFVALDASAALCIAMTFYSAWRGESGGVPHLLVWVFAGLSALANYRNGLALADQGAKDAVWFFPIMSIAGAGLLEVVMSRVRRWARVESGHFEAPLPKFRFLRWIVAYGETKEAWKTAILEGYSKPRQAIDHVRGETVPEPMKEIAPVVNDDPETLRNLLTSGTQKEAVKYASAVLGTYDNAEIRTWLESNGGPVVDRSNASKFIKELKDDRATELRAVN